VRILALYSSEIILYDIGRSVYKLRNLYDIGRSVYKLRNLYDIGRSVYKLSYLSNWLEVVWTVVYALKVGLFLGYIFEFLQLQVVITDNNILIIMLPPTRQKKFDNFEIDRVSSCLIRAEP